MEYPRLGDVFKSLSAKALSGKEMVEVSADDLSYLLFYVTMENPSLREVISPKGELSPMEVFLLGVKSICLRSGYNESNWDKGAHDWSELYRIGYTDPREAFEHARSCK